MIDFEDDAPRKPFETMIPLINVVFLLLIFFLLVGTMEPSSENPNASVTLPTGALDDKQQDREAPVMLTVEADGFVWFGDRVMDPKLAGVLLKPELAGSAADRVSIRADEAAPAEAVLLLMETLREAGVKQVTIVTERGR
ncbi:MAG: biopolymer transporter ExbD [Parvibaculum sp.]